MRRTALALLILPFLAACSHIATRTASQVDTTHFKRVYVQHLLTDGKGIDQLIARELRKRGYDASAGPIQLMPAGTDALILYQDRWTFDFTDYLIRLDLEVRNTQGDKLLAEGYLDKPSVAGNNPVDMVDKLLDRLFKPRGPAFPTPPPAPGPESTSPMS